MCTSASTRPLNKAFSLPHLLMWHISCSLEYTAIPCPPPQVSLRDYLSEPGWAAWICTLLPDTRAYLSGTVYVIIPGPSTFWTSFYSGSRFGRFTIMADPLSISSAAAGLISLGLEACRGLLAYTSAFQSHDKDIDAIRHKLLTLQTFLNTTRLVVNSLPENATSRQNDAHVLATLEDALQLSEKGIQDLARYLEKCCGHNADFKYTEAGNASGRRTPSDYVKRAARMKQFRAKSVYFFRKETIKELERTVDTLQQPLGLILTLLSMYVVLTLRFLPCPSLDAYLYLSVVTKSNLP